MNNQIFPRVATITVDGIIYGELHAVFPSDINPASVKPETDRNLGFPYAWGEQSQVFQSVEEAQSYYAAKQIPVLCVK